MKQLTWMSLTAACLSVACSGQTPQAPSSQPQPAPESTPETAAAAVLAKQQISTQPLNPEPIQISLSDLPEPYATQSASQSW